MLYKNGGFDVATTDRETNATPFYHWRPQIIKENLEMRYFGAKLAPAMNNQHLFDIKTVKMWTAYLYALSGSCERVNGLAYFFSGYYYACNVFAGLTLCAWHCFPAQSPWYNRSGWLGVKHQVTAMFLLKVKEFPCTVASSTHIFFSSVSNTDWYWYAYHCLYVHAAPWWFRKGS